MASQTFLSLNSAKRRRIEDALLHEFSSHPLAEAQVARIVSEAGIARGAFYVYFSDLTDAYRHTITAALGNIHGGLVNAVNHHRNDFLQAFYDYTLDSIRQMASSPYRNLFHLHWQINESQLACRTPAAEPEHGANQPSTPVERFFSSHPLVVDGHELLDHTTNTVVINTLTHASHQCVRDALNGTPTEQVMQNFGTLLDILRRGLLATIHTNATQPRQALPKESAIKEAHNFVSRA